MNLNSKGKAIQAYREALLLLQKEGVLLNKKDFTSQIGEWLVESIYDGKRAKSGIQKAWDIDINGKLIQVKTHSKKVGNKNRWSPLQNYDEKVDELIVIVFSPDYRLLEFYQVPWSYARQQIQIRGKKKPRPEVNWSSLKAYKVDINKLPRQDIISLFK